MDPFSHALWSVIVFKSAKILNFRVVPRPLRGSALEEFRGVQHSSAHTPTLSRSIFWVMLFSVFPDMLSSVPFLIWRTVYLTVLNNHFSLDIILREWTEQVPPNIFALFDAVYNLSHSIFLFGAVLILLFILKRQKMNGVKLRCQLREVAFTPIWAWGLHLALDLISHAGFEHGVRLFYPFTDFYFGLANWFNTPFMLINAVVLGVAGIIILVKSKKILR